jgi:predicted nucleotidyltransferase
VEPDEADLAKVRAILHSLVPEIEVRAFGSRVRGTPRKTSDLALALMTAKPLDLARMADLRDAFSESDLAFKVDLVEWAATSPSFRQIIEQNCELVQAAA